MACNNFTDFLSRQSEHLWKDVIRDWRPVDSAYIGHFQAQPYPAFWGTSGTFDRVHVAFPNLASPWGAVDAASCVGTPCDPPTVEIGMGYTRNEFSKKRIRAKTQLFCFDQISSADHAKQQFKITVDGLRKTSSWINSDHLRLETHLGAESIIGTGSGTLNLAGALLTSVTPTWNSTYTVMTLPGGAAPTSLLTMGYLENFVEPLMYNGYFDESTELGTMPRIKLVTDMITQRQLREGDTYLQTQYRFTDFAKGGQFYKFGVSAAAGDFMFATDPFPIRFQRSGTTYYRVFPYINQATTAGLAPVVNPAYVNAAFQISNIIHPAGLTVLTENPQPVHPDMPFLIRDFGGKWQFAMDNLGEDANGCVIENIARNKGLFWADFENAIKYERPELVASILHLRTAPCAPDVSRCTASYPSYVAQTFDSANTPCPA